jgi:hypothetical protein
VGVDPHDAARAAARPRHADQRAEGARVVAAENERHRPTCCGLRNEHCQPIAEVEDLLEIPGALVALRGRLHDRRDDVADVDDAHPELLGELLVEPGVADRGRTHVDAAAPGSEVERRADHGDLARSDLRAHAAEANGKVARAGLEPATPRFSAECSTS